MSQDLTALAYLIASVLFIMALRGLSSPESARQGNVYGIFGMAIAGVTTLAVDVDGMNGLDLVGYIRNSTQWNPLPVVMITSRTMAKHRQQAEQAGVNTYITKPFTEDEVLASIDRELAPRLAG